MALIERQGRAIRDLGRRHGALFHQGGHRAGSLEMADRMFGLLGPDAFMSHCTDLTDADVDALCATGTAVVHNPSAIASVRGYCPVPRLLDRGVTVFLGSDGTAPDRSTDMFRDALIVAPAHRSVPDYCGPSPAPLPAPADGRRAHRPPPSRRRARHQTGRTQ